jgi:hypothetical protein
MLHRAGGKHLGVLPPLRCRPARYCGWSAPQNRRVRYGESLPGRRRKQPRFERRHRGSGLPLEVPRGRVVQGCATRQQESRFCRGLGSPVPSRPVSARDIGVLASRTATDGHSIAAWCSGEVALLRLARAMSTTDGRGVMLPSSGAGTPTGRGSATGSSDGPSSGQ